MEQLQELKNMSKRHRVGGETEKHQREIYGTIRSKTQKRDVIELKKSQSSTKTMFSYCCNNKLGLPKLLKFPGSELMKNLYRMLSTCVRVTHIELPYSINTKLKS